MLRRRTTTMAHHPDCPEEYASGSVPPGDFCICGGRKRPFYPRLVCVTCWRPVKLCRCKLTPADRKETR